MDAQRYQSRGAPEDVVTQLRAVVRPVFHVSDVTVGDGGSEAIRFRGELLVEASQAQDEVAPDFAALGYTALFRREEQVDTILAVPGLLPASGGERAWLPALLFVLTVISVLYVGAGLEQVPQWERFTPQGILQGWPFAGSLLSILAAHELGHYFVARHFGTRVTLPYFIPMPLNLLGTMGAVISMHAPPRNRRELLLTGAAGPLAGILLGVPILCVGLSLSRVQAIPAAPVLIEGNSLLYILLKLLFFGRYLPSNGMDVFLDSVAFGSWAGLWITGANLLPIGQLDGGHVLRALMGGRDMQWLNWVIIAALLGLATQWPAWLLWAGLLVLLGQRPTLILDEITELRLSHRLLAGLMILLFVLTFVPVPVRIGTF